MREEEAKSKPISKTAFVIECTVAKSERASSLECWQEGKKKKEKKELRLFADDGLAGEEGKFFPEERVEFLDLARSIMFAFSSRLAECCLVPSTKSIMRNKKVDCKVEDQIVYGVT